eukprot:5870857-Pleurochrysis_carterae.AAC.2
MPVRDPFGEFKGVSVLSWCRDFLSTAQLPKLELARGAMCLVLLRLFKTCCMLHNMLLAFAGLDNIGQQECDWTTADLDLDEQCAQCPFHLIFFVIVNIEDRQIQPLYCCLAAVAGGLLRSNLAGILRPSPSATMHDLSFGNGNSWIRTALADEAAQNETVVSKEPGHCLLRAALVKHFHVQRQRQRTLWVRTAVHARGARTESAEL